MGPSHNVLLSVFCMNWAIGLCFYPHFSRSRWILMESDCLPWNPGPATSLLCDVSCLTSAELHFLIYAMGAMKYLLHSVLVGVGLLEIIIICSMSAMIIVHPGFHGLSRESPASSLSTMHHSKLFKPTYQSKTYDYRDILEILFLNLLGKTTLGHNPQNPP